MSPTPVNFVLITLGGLSGPNIITRLAHVGALISAKHLLGEDHQKD
jgi:hypothetical protein